MEQKIEEFWEIFKKRQHAEKYSAKKDSLIKWDLELKEVAKLVINNKEIKEDDDYFKLFNSYAKGEVIFNNHGRKLYFKKSY